jgi:hypothetical protein
MRGFDGEHDDLGTAHDRARSPSMTRDFAATPIVLRRRDAGASEEVELRPCTLADEALADRYAEVHRPRHVESLRGFCIATIGLWRAIGTPRVTTVVEYPEGADVADPTKRFMSSEAFRADMTAFPIDAIQHVTATRLRAVRLRS